MPNGPADTATFDVSNVTCVYVEYDIEVNSIGFNADTSAFAIVVTDFCGNGATPLIISDVSITNNSGISSHNAPGVTIGSIEGSGCLVFLGANILTVGSNNISTTFSGVIQDSGSLTKVDGEQQRCRSQTPNSPFPAFSRIDRLAA